MLPKVGSQALRELQLFDGMPVAGLRGWAIGLEDGMRIEGCCKRGCGLTSICTGDVMLLGDPLRMVVLC